MDTLLQHADVALYQAKESIHGYAAYELSRDEFAPGRLALAGELRQALERNELVLHFQPQVDLRTRRVSTVEALVRWHHPERGIVMPDEFIPIVERTGLIMPMTAAVLDAALGATSSWLETEPELTVAVNVSMRNLLDASFPSQVASALATRGVPAGQLELEITERSFVGDTRRIQPVLEQLNTMGVRIAIDDFGTGYFSLALLRRLPVDRLKIDRSFVTGMQTSDDDAAIVRSTIDLGHDLGLRVVAEGVETQAVCDDLMKLGCDTAQGHYFGRPMTADALAGWLEDHGRLHVVRDVGPDARVARRAGSSARPARRA